ncbi:MAG: lytic transglycosylase domain-containing protein [Deltaproteobacteria bacterium]|nr:lytic transglycosylase domain-containing protein [Deltaproteobacteria bacterium]
MSIAIGLALASVRAAAAPAVDPAEADDASLTLADLMEQNKTATALRRARAVLAVAAPESAAAATARLVVAFALLRLKRSEEARAALADLEAHGPELGTYRSFLQQSVAAAMGECEAAAAVAGALPADSSFVYPSAVRVAQCFLTAHDLEQGAAAIARVAAAADSDARRGEAALFGARLLEAKGERRPARDAYREILVRFPLTAAGRSASARLDELRQDGMPVRSLAAAELLPQAEGERVAQRSGRARRLYRTIINQSRGGGGRSLRQAAELGIVELDVVDRRYPRALRRLEQLLSTCTDDELVAHALYLKADILSRRGQVEPAMDAYELVRTSHPDTAYAAEAALAGARLAYNTRDLERAKEIALWLVQAPRRATGSLAIVGGDGALQAGHDSIQDYAVWLLAWIERRRGAPAAVTDSHLAQIDLRSPLGAAALYWRARLAAERGDVADAEVFGNLLAKTKSTSFYALAVADLLRRVNPGCDVRVDLPVLGPTEVSLPPPPAVKAQDLAGVLVLYRYGLASEAQRLVRLLPPQALSATDKTVAAWLYRRCGDVHKATVLTWRLADESNEPQNPVLLDLAYPRPYADVVLSAAAAYDVPVDLVYAVIRQESAFNPRAVSPRRAFGLMQMIRPTAVRLAEEAELGKVQMRQLFEPTLAIRLGTQYLAELLRRFNGNVPAAVAAYHAGETSVDRWLKTRSELEPDEFIEEIPFTTTRAYVKKVLASFGVYRLLYQEGVHQAIRMNVPVAETSAIQGDWSATAGHRND